MLRLGSSAGILLFTVLIAASPLDHNLPREQHVLNLPYASARAGNPRKLQGRFLHITDVHPDPFYRQGSDPNGENSCHRGQGSAGYFGAETTECDTPFTLVNATFEWIKNNVKDDIDFVVWTGDSARHDNDEKYPRTDKQVEQLNEFVVSKFNDVFGKPDNKHDPDPTNDFVVPIVPTYGNNDILPHNIFTEGPNRWTRKYLSIWEKFVPQEQRHTFARGGYFYTEVIPDRLAVFSINTLYFFDSNAAVDGCDDPKEPGYEHFEWLRVQLSLLRQRNMKAILIGHVPPARTDSKQSWDETCYQKYNLWLRQYRDVIVGNLFGHMNLDHFILQDVKELTYKFKIDGIDDEGLRKGSSSISDGFRTEAKADYLNDLRQLWGNLPTPPSGSSYSTADFEAAKSGGKKKRKLKKFLQEIGGPYGERFSLSVVSPSIVPNFFPTLRIIEYNITGLENEHPASTPTAPYSIDLQDETVELQHIPPGPWPYIENFEKDLSLDEDYETAKTKKKKKGKKNKPNFHVPEPPSKSLPPGPGYSPQALTLVSWRQLYVNLTKTNEAVAKEVDADRSLVEVGLNDVVQEEMLNKLLHFELEYDTKHDKVYKMQDLTMRSWLDMAEKIGRSKYDALDEDQHTTEDESEEDEEFSAEETMTWDQDDEEIDTDIDADIATTKKHKKKRKQKQQTLKKNRLWHAFVRRAFVGTKSDEDLEDAFG